MYILQIKIFRATMRSIRLVTRRYTCLIALLLLLLNATPGQTEEKLPLATGEWKPFTSAEMEGYGFFTKIITTAFKEAGIDIQYDFYPWKRCEAYIQTGKSFAAFPYSITVKRKTFAYFSDPVSEATTVFSITKKDILLRSTLKKSMS